MRQSDLALALNTLDYYTHIGDIEGVVMMMLLLLPSSLVHTM